MKEDLEAPASGLPFLSTAFAAHATALSLLAADATHFFMKAVLTAPVSGLPFLLTAFASQLDAPGAAAVFVVGDAEVCAKAMFEKTKMLATAKADLLITRSLNIIKQNPMKGSYFLAFSSAIAAVSLAEASFLHADFSAPFIDLHAASAAFLSARICFFSALMSPLFSAIGAVAVAAGVVAAGAVFWPAANAALEAINNKTLAIFRVVFMGISPVGPLVRADRSPS